MDKKIEKIINDLYMIDGSFKKNEKEVVKIVEELLRAKPDAEVNDQFIEKLHLELVKRMGQLKTEREFRNVSANNGGIFGKLTYSLAGAVLMLGIVAVGTFYYSNKDKGPSGRIAVDLKPRIEALKDSAFGSLVYDPSNPATGKGGTGGGGGPVSADQSTKPAMPIIDMVNYRFVYKGGDIPIQDKVTVYKRVKDLPFADKLAETLGSLNLGLIDLSKFTNTRMTNLSVSEDRGFGYDINMDFREGAVTLFAGQRWQDPYSGCIDQACYDGRKLKESDKLGDGEAIAIADKFLNNYRIDKSVYGEPVVMKDLGLYKDLATQNSAAYVSETVSVVYPLKVDGKMVYDDMASATGMIVEISVRQKKVFSARNIYMQKYESSSYAAEQDKAKIISVVENGGVYGNYQAPEIKQTRDIELGTPEIQLIATWNYDPKKEMPESLFVPSYVFPVIKVSDGAYYYRKNIVVPIPQEMVEKIIRDTQAVSGSLRK